MPCRFHQIILRLADESSKFAENVALDIGEINSSEPLPVPSSASVCGVSGVTRRSLISANEKLGPPIYSFFSCLRRTSVIA
jgi:hypothetical protein